MTCALHISLIVSLCQCHVSLSLLLIETQSVFQATPADDSEKKADPAFFLLVSGSAGLVPDDFGLALCAAWQDVTVRSTQNSTGKRVYKQ